MSGNIYVPPSGFAWRLSSQSAARPVAAAFGTLLTPGVNTMGTAVEVMAAASIVADVYAIEININGGAFATEARDALVDILIDPAGGSAWTVKIASLLGSCAAEYSRGGINYYFPLWLPAGCSIGAQASVNNATARNISVLTRVYGRPFRPALVKAGSYCTTLGATAASSSGTAVTPGTTNEGTWTSLGTTAKDHWWSQLGLGINDATMSTTRAIYCDLSFGSSNVSLIEDQLVGTTSNEDLETSPNGFGYNRVIASGQEIFARAQMSGALDSNYSMCAYLVGG